MRLALRPERDRSRRWFSSRQGQIPHFTSTASCVITLLMIIDMPWPTHRNLEPPQSRPYRDSNEANPMYPALRAYALNNFVPISI
jgi:hypothetical protein